MTSTAAVVGLTYRGTDIQDTDGIFLEIYRGLVEPVEVRGQDLIVPAFAGQIVRNRQGHRLGIGLRGWIRGVDASAPIDEAGDRSDFATNRTAFRALFDRRLDPGALVATLEDGSSLTIDARTLNVIPDQVVPTLVYVDVELESVDPDWAVVTS
jgi:hypothetical protein